MNGNGFIKFNRDNNDNFLDMLLERHTAFCLLTLVAYRAKRTNRHKIKTLKMNQCYIGDYESYGVTRQIYRTDKEFLEKWGFITTETTNKGTVATLVDTTIFDVNAEGTHQLANQRLTNQQPTTNQPATTETTNKGTVATLTGTTIFDINAGATNQPANQPLTNEQPPTNQPATTNKECKKERKKEIIQEAESLIEIFNYIWGTNYRSHRSWLNNFKKWREVYSLEDIKQAIENAKADPWWKDKLDLDKLLRTHEDRIGQLLNRKLKKKPSREEAEQELINLVEGGL
jgi:hypothetical protein